ncbi:hypothetical protein BZG36_05529 [Bifiguratus adelaidae]|uniref:Uncharacterized protein n=1 Tax=Bifiguratus adelaidae TaxID=1938954 RepID=A0A261XTE4_9FUNG|nr:hypothetical protein BZG36_05529 [Bifiguratus adelaidae]
MEATSLMGLPDEVLDSVVVAAIFKEHLVTRDYHFEPEEDEQKESRDNHAAKRRFLERKLKPKRDRPRNTYYSLQRCCRRLHKICTSTRLRHVVFKNVFRGYPPGYLEDEDFDVYSVEFNLSNGQMAFLKYDLDSWDILRFFLSPLYFYPEKFFNGDTYYDDNYDALGAFFALFTLAVYNHATCEIQVWDSAVNWCRLSRTQRTKLMTIYDRLLHHVLQNNGQLGLDTLDSILEYKIRTITSDNYMTFATLLNPYAGPLNAIEIYEEYQGATFVVRNVIWTPQCDRCSDNPCSCQGSTAERGIAPGTKLLYVWFAHVGNLHIVAAIDEHYEMYCFKYDVEQYNPLQGFHLILRP